MNRILQTGTAVPRLWLFALVVWLVVGAIATVNLWHLRQNAMEAQSREIELLSLALIDEVERGLRGVEDGLNALQHELHAGHTAPDESQTRQTLTSSAKLMPLVRSVWLISQNGEVLSRSDDAVAPDLQSFAPLLQETDRNTPAVSRPFVGAMGDKPTVAIAVRLDDKSGNSASWIAAGIPASALLGAFSAASPVAGARMAVFRNDGVLLAGSLLNVSPLNEGAVAQRLADRPDLYLHKFRDGSNRLVSQRNLSRYGLIMVLTRNMDTALAPWRETALISAFGMVLLLAILGAAVYLVAKADKRNAEVQRALQAQRSRASRLESLGTLAGGIAHDFNNILAAILGFGEMARDAASPDSNQARHLDKVLQATSRGKALAERILTFSRGGAHSLTVFEFEPVIREVLNLLSASLPPNVILTHRFEASAARLRGDPTQAFEAVMNLCTNAIHAMANTGGTLDVRFERRRVATPKILSHSQLAAGDYLLLSVSDQGIGITSDMMEHLFEPFFTSRNTQSGNGFGLAIVHSVVVEFGGAVDVQSTPGLGACFNLYFPESAEKSSATQSSIEVVPVGTGQRILVVDDEPDLVALAEETLKGLGYRSVGYDNPERALRALHDDPTGFDAVITDEVMPNLSGTQLTEALRAVAPRLPVLLISGYGGASLAVRAEAAGINTVLSKPLRRAELARALSTFFH